MSTALANPPFAPPTAELAFLLKHVVAGGLDGDDVDAVLDQAGRFAADVLAPLNQIGDRDGAVLENGTVRTPAGFADAYANFCEMGWNGAACDPDFGGMGLPQAVGSALDELWNGANMAFALCPLLTHGAVSLLGTHGTPAQKERWLRPMIAGSWTGSMNLTEPQAGSDLSAVRTKARREGDHYRVTGQKIYITYGDHDFTDNIVHLVLARLPDAPPGVKGISLFVVPKRLVEADGALGAANDLRCASLEHKLGIHASPTAVMLFGEAEGAWAELVGEENRGLEYMFTMMNSARLGVGVQGVGIAERAHQQAVLYARQRTQGRDGASKESAAIIRHPDVRRMILLNRVKIAAARALALETAATIDRAEAGEAGEAGAQARVDLLIPIVKAWSTDLANEVTSTAVQIHGGMGFIEDTGAAQHFRDARIAAIYEGTNGIQAIDLMGRKVQRDGGAAMTALLSDIRAVAETHPALAEAASHLTLATDWLLAQKGGDPRLALAVATPYLELAGLTLGAWMLARSATAATKLDAGLAATKQADFVFYAHHLLSRTGGLARTITEGADSVLAIGDEGL